jgi:hypothetical protein
MELGWSADDGISWVRSELMFATGLGWKIDDQFSSGAWLADVHNDKRADGV